MARGATLRIDLDSPIPAYRQIVDSLRALLVEGSLQPDDVLPPVRELALDLGVHFNTVAEAYRILADEGWLDLKRRRGAKVLARNTPPAPEPQKLASFTQRLRALVAEARSDGIPGAQLREELRLAGEGLES